MDILLVSTSFPVDASDWKGVFIFQMAAALERANFGRIKLWAPPGQLPDNVVSVLTPREALKLQRLMAAGGISHLMRTHPVGGMRAAAGLLLALARAYRRQRDFQLYHVNWLQCALPLPDDHKPALITVLGNDMKFLEKPMMRSALRRVMRRRNVAICPNADWMVQPLRDIFGDVAEVTAVPFGIDELWYGVERKLDERPKWLVVTRLTSDKLGKLFDWSESLFADWQRELHLFGPMQECMHIPSWICYHGAATPEQLSTEWFPRACGLISLSQHAEGRPQVMLEAMAAGLPVVASRMPAHADIVEEGVTGLLCDSAREYERALEALEDVATNQRIGASSRDWIARELGTWDDCAQRYVRIYRRLLGQVGNG